MIRNFTRFFIFLIVTSLFVLSSCSPPYEERDVAVKDLQTKNQALASAEEYLQTSYYHSPPKSFEYTLMAIEMFLEANEIASAKHWLHQVPAHVPEYLQIHRNMLKAQINLQEKNFLAA
ncbi:MAG TPA: hypothetical protein VFP93_04015, partial [Gammaproteobacteria bacterium]|nr:hypothetical protein [Gammaproteobacteria bacterium]